MLEKILNQHVNITTVAHDFVRGTVTKVEGDFIEIDYKGRKTLVREKYIATIRFF